jgi:hypothetical protein
MKEEENLQENYQWPIRRLVIVVKHEHCIQGKEVSNLYRFKTFNFQSPNLNWQFGKNNLRVEILIVDKQKFQKHALVLKCLVIKLKMVGSE